MKTKQVEKKESPVKPERRPVVSSDDSDDEDYGDMDESKSNAPKVENKLAALNEMLKNKQFEIQKQDEDDFE